MVREARVEMTWLAVAVGGALGASARYGLQSVVDRRLGAAFPFGIVAVNVLGCFVAGLLAGAVAGERLLLSSTMRALAFTGILGGFTTFSAFGLDTHALARSGDWGSAVVNVVGQVGLGMMAVWLGFLLGGGR
jgi:CrcB protein